VLLPWRGAYFHKKSRPQKASKSNPKNTINVFKIHPKID
jgi:hypothetical protein